MSTFAKMAAIVLLVVHLLSRMRSFVEESPPEMGLSPTSVQSPPPETNSALKTILILARNHNLRNHQELQGYQELSHRVDYVRDNEKSRYYQASIRYRVRNLAGEDIIQTQCYTFNEAGALVRTYTCE